MAARGMASGRACSLAGEVAGRDLYRSARVAQAARCNDAMAARQREAAAAGGDDAAGLSSRAAILGSGALAAAAIGFIPPAVAIEGIDFSPESLAGIDIPGLIAANPNGAGIAIIAGLLGLKLVAIAAQGVGGRAKAVRPSALAQIVKSSPRVAVVDMRPRAGRSGGPDWGRYGKRAASIPYSPAKGNGVDSNFGRRVARLRGVGNGAMVVLVDADGTLAPSAAREVLKLPGIGSVRYIKGGAEGWKASGMPWRSGLALPSITLPSVSVDGIAESYRANPGAYNLGLGAGVAAISTALLISELDALLEVVGLIGFAQLFLRNMVFAEDRKQAMGKLREIRDEKIAVGSAGQDLRRLASAVLDGKKGRPYAQAGAAVDGVKGSDDAPGVSSVTDASTSAAGSAQ
ncbi:unnamed protein product [Ostreobium quekettii]|uniref:Rhodanese domain-containing protein n=1 Tax=Ostreobium quekettii TaxID=121088 RepID=A0A8S1INV0_9CHLO|nr:unnamed protein product [Ostreobium quekettii]